MARLSTGTTPAFKLDAGTVVRQIRAHCAAGAAPGALASFLRRLRHRSADADALPLHEDPDSVRFLRRLGAVDASRSPARVREQVARLLEDAARAGAAEPAVASVLVRAFAAGIHGVVGESVCGDAPRCDRCPLADSCRERVAASPRRAPYGPGESPTERLRRDGASSLATDEVMAVLTAHASPSRETDAASACDGLLRRSGGLRGLAELSADELAQSLDERAATVLAAAMELCRRWAAEPRANGRVFRTGADLYDHYRLALRDLKKEVFVAVVLDQRNRFLADEWCSLGTLTASLVHPREAFRRAVRESAASIAFVHNHPSGNPQPSPQDRDLTARLVEASKVLGIRLVDHVIVGDGSFLSFAESGLL